MLKLLYVGEVEDFVTARAVEFVVENFFCHFHAPVGFVNAAERIIYENLISNLLFSVHTHHPYVMFSVTKTPPLTSFKMQVKFSENGFGCSNKGS